MNRLIILDTNVISEMIRARPDPRVMAWYLRQEPKHLCTTSVTVAEVLFGLAIMPNGQRRNALLQLAITIFEEELQHRVFPFDEVAANHYSQMRAGKRKKGLQMTVLDAQIAAIALTLKASIATRNTADFAHCGVALIDPWLALH